MRFFVVAALSAAQPALAQAISHHAAHVQSQVNTQNEAALTLGEVIGCDFAAYPNVRRWLARMKALKSWQPVNATLDGAAAAHKGESFVTV